MKTAINIDKFVESKEFLYDINQIKIKDFDFSCVFNKDLKQKDKKILYKQFDNLEKLLTCFFVVKTYHNIYGVEFRPEIIKYIND